MLAITAMVVSASRAGSAPGVTQDPGYTLAIDRLAAPSLEENVARERARPVQPIRTPEALLRTLLPVATPQMKPGAVAKRTIELSRLQRPLCLVGADPRSVDWLRRHRRRLADLGAVCLLVQAAHIEDLRRVLEAAGGLPVLPTAGSTLALRLGLTRYPALVTTTAIEQ